MFTGGHGGCCGVEFAFANLATSYDPGQQPSYLHIQRFPTPFVVRRLATSLKRKHFATFYICTTLRKTTFYVQRSMYDTTFYVQPRATSDVLCTQRLASQARCPSAGSLGRLCTRRYIYTPSQVDERRPHRTRGQLPGYLCMGTCTTPHLCMQGVNNPARDPARTWAG